MRGKCKNFEASGISLLHPRGRVVAHTSVLWPCRCHLTWQGFPRLGAAALPITLPISLPITLPAHSLRGTSLPLSTQFSATETAGHEAGPSRQLLPLLPALLSKGGGGKCSLGEDQTFTRPLPSETSFVENLKVVPYNLGWGEQTKEHC